ncbi:MAG: MBL fold metallo-hydrolase [Candidatus Aenigmarchaeota archaeon]|nr:MBL fold metallo-hydrolase [Candidatus Aenigmarchaeota archaeon]
MEKSLLVALVAVLISLVAVGLVITKLPVELPPLEIPAELKALPARISAIEASLEKKIEGPIYGGTSLGFVIEFENGKRLYISGDTGLMADMKFIIGDYYKPDIALLTCGGVFTMDMEAAAFATTLINPEKVGCMHYGTFPILDGWTGDPLKPNVTKFVKLVNQYRAEGKTRAVPLEILPGDTINLDGVKIEWLGHENFLITTVKGTKILVDTWFEGNPGCPEKYKNVDVLEGIYLLLLTHLHLDHFSPDEFSRIVKKHDPIVIVEWESGEYLRATYPEVKKMIVANKGGVLDRRVIENFLGIQAPEMEGIKVILVAASHTSSPPFKLWRES